MPSITVAYQSFNSNASTEHGAKSIVGQYFTKIANQKAIEKGYKVLVCPTLENDMGAIVQGPQNLVPIDKLPSKVEPDEFLQSMSEHISNIFNLAPRVFSSEVEIAAIGEFDYGKLQGATLFPIKGYIVSEVTAKKACQCFTLFIKDSKKVEILEQGIGFVACECDGIVLVFVHVPNDDAKTASKTTGFYKGISDLLKKKNKNTIHVVMGDTNQPSDDYTAGVLKGVFGKDFETATAKKTEHVNIFGAQPKGTNSTGTVNYDVIVYSTDKISKVEFAPISSSATGTTTSDHSGISAKINIK